MKTLGVIAVFFALAITACGEADKLSDHQTGDVTYTITPAIECRGAIVNRDFFEKGGDFGQMSRVSVSKNYKALQQGDVICDNPTGATVTIQFENRNGGKETKTASAKLISWTSTDKGFEGFEKKEVPPPGVYTLYVTTSSITALVVSASLDGASLEGNALKGMDQTIQKGSVATYSNVGDGLFAINCRINQVGSDKLEQCLKGGVMDNAFALYITSAAQKDPKKLVTYVAQDGIEKPDCMMTATGICKDQGDPIEFVGNPPGDDPTNTNPTIGTPFGKDVDHVGYTGDVANWSQAGVYVFRMVGTAESVSLVNDTTRTAGTVAKVSFSGVVSSSQAEQHFRQVRLPAGTLVNGKVYIIQYCLYSSAGGRLSVEVHQTSGQPGQPWPNAGIYIQDIKLAAGTWFCDGWEFTSQLDTAQFFTFHTANLSGDFMLDDARVIAKP